MRANAGRASQFKEELEGERDVRIRDLESELANRRVEITMLEDTKERRAKLQIEMDGMMSWLDNLCGDVRIREEELASLQGGCKIHLDLSGWGGSIKDHDGGGPSRAQKLKG